MEWKKVTITCLCTLLLGTSLSYAAGGVESIRAHINHDMKITINNKPWIPVNEDGDAMSPVIINGISYLPTKAVVEMLGGEVRWDNTTNTISITSVTESNGSSTERDRMILNKVNELKEKLRLGLTQEEVKSLFMDDYEIANDNGDLENGSDSYWKYSFFKEPGYNRVDIPDHVIDQEGLKNNKVGVSLFIGWKENKLHMYSIAYVDPKDKQVYLL